MEKMKPMPLKNHIVMDRIQWFSELMDAFDEYPSLYVESWGRVYPVHYLQNKHMFKTERLQQMVFDGEFRIVKKTSATHHELKKEIQNEEIRAAWDRLQNKDDHEPQITNKEIKAAMDRLHREHDKSITIGDVFEEIRRFNKRK